VGLLAGGLRECGGASPRSTSRHMRCSGAYVARLRLWLRLWLLRRHGGARRVRWHTVGALPPHPWPASPLRMVGQANLPPSRSNMRSSTACGTRPPAQMVWGARGRSTGPHSRFGWSGGRPTPALRGQDGSGGPSGADAGARRRCGAGRSGEEAPRRPPEAPPPPPWPLRRRGTRPAAQPNRDECGPSEVEIGARRNAGASIATSFVHR